MNGRRLFRHPTDKQIGGVAAGLAAFLDLDPTIVRVGWIVLAIFTSGVFLLVYFVMLLVVPLPPPGWTIDGRPIGGPGAGPAGAPGGPSNAAGWGASSTGGWQPGAGAPGGWQAPADGSWGTGRDDDRGLDAGNAGIVAGIILIALGTWFLVDRYVGIRIDWALAWPVAIMAVGGYLVYRASRAKPRT